MSEIAHIVFDIGRVLIHYDPNIPFSRILPDEGERKWFFDNVCTHDWNIEQDRGRSWEEAESLLIERFGERASQIRFFRQSWAEMVSHAYGDSVDIMLGLINQGRDVTMLTNFADDTFTEAQKRFDFLNKARGVTVSARVGLIKPDPAIYRLHEAKFGLDAKASLFIDDAIANVEAARGCGWQAIHFTDAGQLKRDLAAYGILG